MINTQKIMRNRELKDVFLSTRISNSMKLDLKCISKIENKSVGLIVRKALKNYLYE
tara:strand:- start:500 stop:667 length:168 start_codon:yes stop_codon:yes gene_type:complete